MPWTFSPFGQKNDLCARIKEICRNYPEGTSIIKVINLFRLLNGKVPFSILMKIFILILLFSPPQMDKFTFKSTFDRSSSPFLFYFFLHSTRQELIQNADDAGARCFKLCLDHREHGVSTVVGPNMAKYQVYPRHFHGIMILYKYIYSPFSPLNLLFSQNV